MTIKLNDLQLAKLRKNVPSLSNNDPDAMAKIKPVIAIVAPLVSPALAQIEPNQFVRPEIMLVAYGASPKAPNIVRGLLQLPDRSFTLGWYDLDAISASARAADTPMEVLDLVGKCPSALDAGMLCLLDDRGLAIERIRPLKDAAESLRDAELVLVLPSPHDDRAVLQASLELRRMNAQRLREVRPQLAPRSNREQRRSRRRRW